MQRLFSRFPYGQPAIGLLLLRVLLSFILVEYTIACLRKTSFTLLTGTVAAVALGSAACLLMGFMTPIPAGLAAGLVGFVPVGFAVFRISSPAENLLGDGLIHIGQLPLGLMIVAVAVVFLGPGAFSLDARMFGPREIRIPTTNHSTKP